MQYNMRKKNIYIAHKVLLRFHGDQQYDNMTITRKHKSLLNLGHLAIALEMSSVWMTRFDNQNKVLIHY